MSNSYLGKWQNKLGVPGRFMLVVYEINRVLICLHGTHLDGKPFYFDLDDTYRLKWEDMYERIEE